MAIKTNVEFGPAQAVRAAFASAVRSSKSPSATMIAVVTGGVQRVFVEPVIGKSEPDRRERNVRVIRRLDAARHQPMGQRLFRRSERQGSSMLTIHRAKTKIVRGYVRAAPAGTRNTCDGSHRNNRENSPMASDPQFVAALSHGLAILRCFSPDQSVLTNGALARMTGMARSSVSRLTHTLVKLGYLDYDTGTGAYRLGMCVLPLQPAALAGARVVETAVPQMVELADRMHARVLLTVYDSFGLTVVHGICTNPDIPGPRGVGSRYHIPRRAMGRAYIACCSEHEQEQILHHLAQGHEGKSDALREERDTAVRSYRRYGYCTSLSEIRPGNHSISMTLNLPHLGRRLILSCGGPAELLPERTLRDRIAPLLMNCATLIERISAQMPPARVH